MAGTEARASTGRDLAELHPLPWVAGCGGDITDAHGHRVAVASGQVTAEGIVAAVRARGVLSGLLRAMARRSTHRLWSVQRAQRAYSELAGRWFALHPEPVWDEGQRRWRRTVPGTVRELIAERDALARALHSRGSCLRDEEKSSDGGLVMSAVSTRYRDSRATRELLGMVRDAALAAPCPVVVTAVAILGEALHHGDALGACGELQRLAPRGAAPFDTELYGAAISLGSALGHVEAGTDAGAALDAAQAHLHAALDAHQPAVGAR